MSLPEGVVPVRDLTTREVLYGARTTTFRYEVLSHDTATGADSLAGYLDGVKPGGTLRWVAGEPVKKACDIDIADLATARAGMIRVGDLNLITARIRPVIEIEGLPDIPLGVYVVTAAPEAWAGTGRTYPVELHDKSTVLDQDKVEESFTAGTSDSVLTIVQQVIESAGERITVDASETRTLASPLVWPPGTTKMTIVNDLLDALNYNSLWVDGSGSFRATPYVRPAQRSIRYAVLNDADGVALMRELADGDESIYLPDWTRDRDVYAVPNKMIAVAQGSADSEPLSGTWKNETTDEDDPLYPFSYAGRGRWIVEVLDGVEVPDYSGEVDPDSAVEDFLEEKARQSLIARSAVQAGVSVKCLPIPLELLDALRFASAPAGIDARHTAQSIELSLAFDGLMTLDLLEVVDL